MVYPVLLRVLLSSMWLLHVMILGSASALALHTAHRICRDACSAASLATMESIQRDLGVPGDPACPLVCAVLHNRHILFRAYLQDMSTDINADDGAALYVAMEKGHVAFFNALLKSPRTDINAGGGRILQYAIRESLVDFFHALLAKRALCVNIRDLKSLCKSDTPPRMLQYMASAMRAYSYAANGYGTALLYAIKYDCE